MTLKSVEDCIRANIIQCTRQKLFRKTNTYLRIKVGKKVYLNDITDNILDELE